MKTLQKTFFLLLAMLVLSVASALAQGPVVFFTDLTSGPNSGGENNNGAIVTIYGKRFGASQGNSTVKVGTGAVAAYKLWSDNKIAVAIGSAASTGAIVVQTIAGASTCADRVTSCNFTVRSGHLYFVAAAGNDSNNGSFASPWLTLLKARASMVAGDITYAENGVSQTTDDGQGCTGGCALSLISSHGVASGTAAAPIALLAYPGATVTVGNSSTLFEAIKAANVNYWTIGGLSIRGQVLGIDLEGPVGMRLVGNNLQCPSGDGQNACMDTSQSTSIEFLGNEVTNAGCSETGTPCANQTASTTLESGSANTILICDGSGNNCGSTTPSGWYAGYILVVSGQTRTVGTCYGTNYGTCPISSQFSPPINTPTAYQYRFILPNKQYHSVYFSTDSNSVEAAFNNIHDNASCRGIQFHSSPVGGTTGQDQYNLHVHDNLIHGQTCDGINFATVDPSKGTVEAYNNIIYHVGAGPDPGGGQANYSCIYSPDFTNTGLLNGTGVAAGSFVRYDISTTTIVFSSAPSNGTAITAAYSYVGGTVTGESIATGDGVTVSFTHSFAHSPTSGTLVITAGVITAVDTSASGTISIFNNTMYDCGSGGTGGTSNHGVVMKGGLIANLLISLKNNISYQLSGEYYLSPTGLPQISGSSNLWYCTGTCPATPALGGDSTGNPLLTSLVTPDFHLQSTSPAINGGVTLATASPDFDGVPRPQNTTYALGAYEFVPLIPDLTIAKTHCLVTGPGCPVGNFRQQDVGDTYAITVYNVGTASTSGTITLNDNLAPTGLTATGLSSTDPLWVCTTSPTLGCSRSDSLTSGNSVTGYPSYPPITLTVSVPANAATGSFNNTATVCPLGACGGETNTSNDTAINPTTILPFGSTTTGVVSSASPGNTSVYGQAVTFTATVTFTPACGALCAGETVTFYNSASQVGTGTLNSSGAATCATCPVFVVGSYSITAVYSGDLNYSGSNSTASPVPLTVSKATPTVTFNAAPTPTYLGGNFTVSATTTNTDSTTLTYSYVSGPCAFVSGSTFSSSGAGTCVVSASGAATANFNLVSNTQSVTITPATPTVTFSAAPTPNYPSNFTVSATTTNTDPLTLTYSYVSGPCAFVSGSTFSPTGGGTCVVQARGAATANFNAALNQQSVTITIPDLTITMTHSGSLTQGQSGSAGVPYSILVSNVGNGPTSGTVTVTDTLPASLTATAMSGTGWACVLGTLTCTRSDVLAAGAYYPVITLMANVAGNAVAPVTNSVAVCPAGACGGETNTANDTATDTATTVYSSQAGTDLIVTDPGPGVVTLGQTGVVYTITVSNIGGAATSGTVTMTETLPASVTATAISGTGWTCVLATLTCTRSDVLAIGFSYPVITLTVNIAVNAPATVTPSAAVTGGGDAFLANDASSDVTTVTPTTPAADLIVAVTDSGNFKQGQGGSTYTITVSNVGGAATSGTVTMTDTLPAGVTGTAMVGTGWTCTLATLTCTRSDALASASSYLPITLTVSVASNAAASVTDTATVCPLGACGGETNIANDTGADITAVTQTSQPAPAPSPVPQPPTIFSSLTATGSVGTAFSYSILATNSANSYTASPLPAGLSVNTGTGVISGTPTAAGTTFVNLSASNNVGTATATLSLTINSSGVPDLTVTKSHSPASFNQGQSGTYTITVSNIGGAATSGTVTVVDTLPQGLTATAMGSTDPLWSCTLGTLTCTRGDALAAGSSYPAIALTVSVAANAPASVTNTVVVSGGGEQNTSNDTASDLTNITAVAVIGLSPTALQFVTSVGAANPPAPQTFQVQNLGGGTLGWTATAATTSGGNWLAVSPGTNVAPSTLTVTVNPAGLALGTYTGSVSIAAVPGVTVSNSPQLLQVQLAVGAPLINVGGIVNAASYAPDGVVSPGEIASLFGQNLAAGTVVASAVPLPTILGGVQVLVNGTAAPLFAVSPLQINFEMPYEVTGSSAKVVVVGLQGNSPQPSLPVTVSLVSADPGIFSVASSGAGQGAVLNADASLNSASNPAAAGSTIAIYVAGMGAVNPSLASGQPGGSSPPNLTVAAPTVLIGGVQVPPTAVSFSGVAPGYSGLYQINATIPAGTKPGNAVTLQIQAGGRSSNTVTIAVH